MRPPKPMHRTPPGSHRRKRTRGFSGRCEVTSDIRLAAPSSCTLGLGRLALFFSLLWTSGHNPSINFICSFLEGRQKTILNPSCMQHDDIAFVRDLLAGQ